MSLAIGLPPVPQAPLEKQVTRPATSLPPALTERFVAKESVRFDPKIHLDCIPPKKFTTMKDIGYEGRGISPIAVTEPFSLFTQEAIKQMRADIFSKEVLENCQVSSSFASHMIRAYAPKRYRQFAYDAWTSPEVLGIISEIAGVELVPSLEVDIGHVNVSFSAPEAPAHGQGAVTQDDDVSAFGWHFDSVPFVVVTMLSDCTGMNGGETAIRTASGEVVKVRGPTMGTAVVMQGRYIEHQALKAFGGPERLAMVTSLRPKSPFVKDETVLNGIRGITDQDTMYYQYADYQYENFGARFAKARETALKRRRDGAKFDVDGTRAFLEEQKQVIELLLSQIVADSP